jgi:hypothetical protein
MSSKPTTFFRREEKPAPKRVIPLMGSNSA